MNLRKLEPGELIDPSKPELYYGRSGIRVKNIKDRGSDATYRYLVEYDNGKFESVTEDGSVYSFSHDAITDYDLFIIESPEMIERDWSEVVDDLGRAYFGSSSRSEFQEEALKILQQVDKPKPEPVTVKMWVNVYSNGTDSYDSKIEADDFNRGRIAIKEIEFTYIPGEGLDDQ